MELNSEVWFCLSRQQGGEQRPKRPASLIHQHSKAERHKGCRRGICLHAAPCLLWLDRFLHNNSCGTALLFFVTSPLADVQQPVLAVPLKRSHSAPTAGDGASHGALPCRHPGSCPGVHRGGNRLQNQSIATEYRSTRPSHSGDTLRVLTAHCRNSTERGRLPAGQRAAACAWNQPRLSPLPVPPPSRPAQGSARFSPGTPHLSSSLHQPGSRVIASCVPIPASHLQAPGFPPNPAEADVTPACSTPAARDHLVLPLSDLPDHPSIPPPWLLRIKSSFWEAVAVTAMRLKWLVFYIKSPFQRNLELLKKAIYRRKTS